MKLAIVHDWLNSLGGAERVLIELHHIFPEAPIYTLFENKKFTATHLTDAEIRTSWLQKFPLITKTHKYLTSLMASAIESFDLSDFDIVLSSSAVFSKGLILKPQTKHICYCYSPTRFLWDQNYEYREYNKKGDFRDILLPIYQHWLRIWDRHATDRVDQFVAISNFVAERIKKYYHRDSTVIYPPITLSAQNSEPSALQKNYYLIVSRLFPHKNIDIAIEAFNKLGYDLKIVGTGPAQKKLQKIASKNIEFLGHLSDRRIAKYYQGCRAFIMPQEEDFGLTPLEAMSFGKPVLALRRGGAIETMIEGVTGEFFDDPIPEALADGIRRLNNNYPQYNPETIRLHAQKFSRENFKKQIIELVSSF